MFRKRDYEVEIAKYLGVISKRKNHTQDELDAIGRNLPIRVMRDSGLMARFCVDNGLSLVDSLIMIAWIASQMPFLRDIKVDNDVTYDEACKCYENVRIKTVVLHRVNYILHGTMLSVYDILQRDGRMRFAVKKECTGAEKVWQDYIVARKEMMERTSWYTLMDYLRLAEDSVSPQLEKVYETIRDNMIYLGLRDVELRARCAVVFLLGKVAGHSYDHYFDQFRKESGIDFRGCFAHDDMHLMVSRFAEMCKVLGLNTEKDEYGYYMLKGYSPEDCVRFRSAWKDFIGRVRDEDAMDEVAKKAIGLNPEAREEYNHILEESMMKEVEESIDRLGEKYNVKKL